MEQLYEWIRNITFYLIFMTVVINLLPNKKYDKYLRFFSGMVLILLVVKPLTGSLRLDDRIAYYFESITFKKEAGELSDQLSKMEETRLKGMIDQYQKAIETDLKSMAETEGLVCTRTQVTIDSQESNESFGHVTAVSMTVKAEKEQTGAIETESMEIVSVKGISQVDIEPVLTEDNREEDKKEERNRQQEENSRLAGLRRRIAEYYDLEEQDIEIQLENGEG